MQISYENFIEIVTPHSLHEIKIHAVPRGHKIAQKQYCEKLSLRGACSGECKTCILKIKKGVDWINALPEPPRDPYGMFTQIVKIAFGQRVEEMNQRPVVKLETNLLGERTERSGFDMFLESINA